MKTLNWIFIFLIGAAGWTTALGQSSGVESEVPGDNFSLEGALEIFKKSASPEEFEQLLNSPDSKVNNLDLNNDGNTDYIKVIDRNEGNVHAFVLQDIISETESQDVAVIELQKLQDGRAVLQIIGDANVYGIETIIEPSEDVRVNAGTSTARNVVNVWAWPSVQYVYGPYYNPWVSPWGWSYSPMWWRPWRPVAYYTNNPWWRPYRSYYSVCYSHRIGYMSQLYRPYRTTSSYVYNNYHNQINHYRSNYAGRSRYDGGRDRYQGYGGRTRSEYQYTNYGRHESNVNRTNNQYQYSDRIHQNNTQNNFSNSHSRTTSGNFDRSSSGYRNYSEQAQHNTNVQQRGLSTERNVNQFQQQRQATSSFYTGSHQLRSSQSFGGSSRSLSHGGGNGGNLHGGGGSNFGGHSQRGRH